MRWILRVHENNLSHQALTTNALLMRWLITKDTPPPMITTAAVVEPLPSPPPPPPPPPPPEKKPVLVSAPEPAGYGCAAAVTYLSTHAAPGYTVVCPGYAGGHYAMTCDNLPSICPGEKVIVIADPCPVAYMNEASNSLVLSGLSDAPIDPYGEDCS